MNFDDQNRQCWAPRPLYDATQAISLPALIVKFHKTPSATFSLAGGALQQRINSDEARKLDPKDDTFEAIYDARYEGS